MNKMVKYFSISDTLENKISFWHIACFLITLPFDRFFNHLVLISFLLHTIIHIRKKNIRSLWHWQTILLSSAFWITLIGIAWSQDKSEGFKNLERQFSILLFPLAFLLSNFPFAQYKRKILQIFGITCIITILYLYADAIRVIRYNGMSITSIFSASFINHNFSEPIHMHATYLSMYIALSLASFVVFFLEEKNNRKSVFYIIGILILIAGLIQLASRSVFIATIVFTFTGLLFLGRMRYKRSKFIFFTLAGSFFILLIITGIESFRKRYVGEFKSDLTLSAMDKTNREPRIDRWRCALELIRKSPVIGYGSGSEKRLLREKYYEKKLYDSYIKELNAHNEYLSTWLKAGIPGLLLFMLTIVTGFVRAIKSRDPVFFSFLMLIAIVSFSENVLDVNKGIFLYAFFFSFFWFSGKPFTPFQRLNRESDPNLNPPG